MRCCLVRRLCAEVVPTSEAAGLALGLSRSGRLKLGGGYAPRVCHEQVPFSMAAAWGREHPVTIVTEVKAVILDAAEVMLS